MARPLPRRGAMLLLTLLHLICLTAAQVGTITQDISTMSLFSMQKPCARSCFQQGVNCPNDNLGSILGCVSFGLCSSRGWQASNDCYCRPDQQSAAQDYLSSCISKSCTVGDVGIDASTAGNIYGEYCLQKGFTPAAAPATVPATATGAATKTAAGGSVPTATGKTSTPPNSSSPSKSSTLSISSIIGIAIASLAGLGLLLLIIRMLYRRAKPKNPTVIGQFSNVPPQRYQPTPMPPPQAVFPRQFDSQPYFQKPAMQSRDYEMELTPDDSASMVSGPARPTQTVVSGLPGQGGMGGGMGMGYGPQGFRRV